MANSPDELNNYRLNPPLFTSSSTSWVAQTICRPFVHDLTTAYSSSRVPVTRGMSAWKRMLHNSSSGTAAMSAIETEGRAVGNRNGGASALEARLKATARRL